MRLVGRYDLYWLVVVTVAVFAIFSRPLGVALDYAHELDQSRDLRLLPGLVVLSGAFLFHQLRKRHEMRAEAIASATEARLATERAAEMERLVGFGQALAKTLDRELIRAAAEAHLPMLAGGRQAWTVLNASDPAGSSGPDDISFPLTVAGATVGTIGVAADPPLTDHQRRVLAAAAALLAVSLKNAELFHEVHENSVRDSLTGCFNRRHALEVMDGELRRSRRSQMPLSLVMFDLDHFKAINDRYGHLCGDAVLNAVGLRMNSVLRGSDLKCRFGGEEFLILLPDTPLAGARRVAETLRRELEEQPVQWREETVRVTASFGVTAVTPGEVDASGIIGRADAALYRAKESGRNCIRTADEQEIPA